MSPCYSPASTQLNAASAALPTIRGLVSSSRSARASKCQQSRLTLETHRPPEAGDQRTPCSAAVQLRMLRVYVTGGHDLADEDERDPGRQAMAGTPVSSSLNVHRRSANSGSIAQGLTPSSSVESAG